MVTAAAIAAAYVVVRKASAAAAGFPLDLRVLFVGAPQHGHRRRAQQDAVVSLECRFGCFRVGKLQRGAQELAIRIESNAAQVVAAVEFVHYVFLGHRDRELYLVGGSFCCSSPPPSSVDVASLLFSHTTRSLFSSSSLPSSSVLDFFGFFLSDDVAGWSDATSSSSSSTKST
ncbi:hypothetical protein AGLY_006629 [Aphis glycines]|uniref:Uncharacterized protein n=1 Tax=Aphis glycines TaxID=307491 RepID=A0A6G0TS35_APHGL|nr:hypothetical protein AGLY_006629 [Aphis glycines]